MSPSAATELDLSAVNAQLEGKSAADIVRWAADTFGSGLVMSTSFGVQSAVMLHLVTRIIPEVPVIFIDTGFHFLDTYRFADQLTQQLKLNLKIYQAPHSSAWTIARHGKLWESQSVDDLNTLDRIHKVEPMNRALDELGATATLAGLRRGQTEHRKHLPPVVLQAGRHKVHPILTWSSKDVHDYLIQHELPYHPLREAGYASIGDWYNTLPLQAGQHEREGRFGGLKQECGLHLPQTPQEDASRESSGL
ncbi:MAG: phosphoadenylyl-sulfate reductase [Phycisphaeraceae bacterium]|nr:phosphoadenylyl-sulfate reductase [Phycisphaeraceae bacterium]